ncbi:hypothetical protein LMG28727_07674 [Paraburkholderia kirstenboschensis]|nr:hypothetical protein LMG28727_07674 [Paraburkholderia kirstenboschensis]
MMPPPARTRQVVHKFCLEACGQFESKQNNPLKLMTLCNVRSASAFRVGNVLRAGLWGKHTT